MASILGSLSFAKLVMMSSAPAKFGRGTRYVSQDPFIHGNQRWLSHTIFTLICIRSAFFYVECNKLFNRKKCFCSP